MRGHGRWPPPGGMPLRPPMIPGRGGPPGAPPRGQPFPGRPFHPPGGRGPPARMIHGRNGMPPHARGPPGRFGPRMGGPLPPQRGPPPPHTGMRRSHPGAPFPPPPPPPRAPPRAMMGRGGPPGFPPPMVGRPFPPPPAMVPPPPQPVAPPPTDPKGTWTKHVSPKGLTYYYNSVTKVSTYDDPASATQPTPAVATAPAPVVAPTTVEQPWQEYTDPTSGKKYYSNGKTTTWDKPAALDTPVVEQKTMATVKKRKRVLGFSSKKGAIDGFKAALLEKDVSPSMKWNELVKLMSSDEIWGALDEFLTTGDRKQALAEYQTKRSNDLKTLERQEKQRARQGFLELLAQKLPSIGGSSASWDEVRDYIGGDERFQAVLDDETRESLFWDFTEEFRKREERLDRVRAKEARDAFVDFLFQREEAGTLSRRWTMDKFVASLDDETKENSPLAASSLLSPVDRQSCFDDYFGDMHHLDEDHRRRIRAMRRRVEKLERDSYRESLRKMASEGKFTPTDSWSAVAQEVSSGASYDRLFHNQGPLVPREIFEEFVDTWLESYRTERELLMDLVANAEAKEHFSRSDFTYDDFLGQLASITATSPKLAADLSQITHGDAPISSAMFVFDELKGKSRLGSLPPTRGNRRRRSDSSDDEGEIIEEEATGSDRVGRSEDVPIATA